MWADQSGMQRGKRFEPARLWPRHDLAWSCSLWPDSDCRCTHPSMRARTHTHRLTNTDSIYCNLDLQPSCSTSLCINSPCPPKYTHTNRHAINQPQFPGQKQSVWKENQLPFKVCVCVNVMHAHTCIMTLTHTANHCETMQYPSPWRSLTVTADKTCSALTAAVSPLRSRQEHHRHQTSPHLPCSHTTADSFSRSPTQLVPFALFFSFIFLLLFCLSFSQFAS